MDESHGREGSTGAVAATSRSQLTETECAIAEIAAEFMSYPELGIDEELFEAGATSLGFLRILTSINRRFDVAVTGAELDEVTVRRLAACVDAELASTEAAAVG